MKKQEVKKSEQTRDNESGCLQGQSFPRSSLSSFPRTAQDRICPVDSSSRKAMNLDTIETGASGDDCGLGGIGESRGNKALCVTGFRLGGRNDRGNRDSESGRSMVEMLGVLAIMGVLAIGGIAGYRYAMDKYNANEILNEVRNRAVTASQQRILGRTIDLSEWNNTIQGHPVTAADNYGGDTSFFALTVSGIEKNVCDKVIKEKIPFAVDTWVGADSDDCIEGNNDITFAFANTLDGEGTIGGGEEPDPACEGVACPEGTSCSKGICICSGTGQEVCGTTCCPVEQMCSSDVGGCVDVAGACANNTDCETVSRCEGGKCYCKISGSYASSEASCYKNYSGTCVSKGTLPDGVDIDGLGTVYQGGYMNWWSARNWCQAHGRKLIDISGNRLGCYQNDGTTPFGGTSQGYCCAEGQASCGRDYTKQSTIMRALTGKGTLNTWLWTGTTYNSCGVLHLNVYDGAIYYNNRNETNAALCE